MSKTKRVCERCNGDIKKEEDNERHYGTCPHCKRGSNFILKNKELQNVADEENDRNKKNSLLDQYGVIEKNERSGKIHVDNVGLAKLIYNECGMHFKTISDESTGKQEIYYYDNGYYHFGGENKIRQTVDLFLDNYTSIHHKNEVVDFIKHKNPVKREELEPPVHLINLSNGIYDLNKNKLINHSPEFFFLNQIPVEYHKSAKCPQIKKFINEVVYKEYVQVVQEIIGYLLYRSYRYNKAFLFYGGGRNGKSTLLDLIKHFIGSKNVSNKTLTSLLENRFSTAHLYGKLANMAGEISGKALVDTSKFKDLTGGDAVDAEKKFYGSFSFYNYAKLLFNANHIPYSKYDKSLAYFQRWIIIVFPETFNPQDARTDPNISDKLEKKEELEGLLLWAIEGLKRLLKNNRFSYFDSENEEAIGEHYEKLAKPSMRFIKDYLRVEPGRHIVNTKVWKKYVDWADERNYPQDEIRVFTRNMKKYLRDKENKIECGTKSTTVNGKKVRVYTNVAWKDQPTSSLRIDSFDVSSVEPKVADAMKKIRKNLQAGYKVDDSWLEREFGSSFIAKLVESGLIIRLPDGRYDIT